MAKCFDDITISIGADFVVSQKQAEFFLRMVEMYLIQNEDKTIRVNRDNGTVRLQIDERKSNRTDDGEGGIIVKYLE